ncbi:DEKNAAC100095 [Brettanomyces naardenensis]|uniref:DEKNAAC100096 n=1 Tax=Brettanomyces naardenensis TaxID=13370 RepID=A0A448YF34_BRENA|nr:DEKNAAC100095 [Brettanomyces naardenensis]
MDLVAKKSVSKVHPNIKRVTCKKCSRLMVPGVTAKWRLMNYSKDKMPKCDILEISCVCGNIKRFPIGQKPDYVLFSERDDVLFDPGKGPADTEERKDDQTYYKS